MSPEAIDALVALGVSAEQLGAAIKAEMAAAEVAKAKKRADDARRKRESRARLAGDVRDVTRTSCDIEGHGVTDADAEGQPSPLPPVPPHPPITPIPTPGTSHGGRDPSAWPKDGFERFYAAYPRKKARQAAEKAYRTVERQKGLTFDLVMAGVQRLVASRPDPDFVPYPATWLRAGQWADEPDPTPRPSARSPPDRLTQADHILNAHHSLFGQTDDRDHHEVEIFPPGSDQSHRRPDRPLHGADAGDVGAGRVRDFRGLRAVG